MLSLQRTARLHATICAVVGTLVGMMAIIEIAIANYVIVYQIGTSVMVLSATGQLLSLVVPASMVSLTIRMKLQLGKTPPSRMVGTVIGLILVSLFSVALNVPQIVQAWRCVTPVSIATWTCVIIYTLAISIGLLVYAGAVFSVVLPVISEEDEG